MTLTDADRQRIAERYPSRKRPWLIPVIAAPLLALLVFWLWISAFHANPMLSADVTRFDVVSDSEIKVTIMVDRARADVSGTCLVYAQAPNFERVGELVVEVPASDRKVDLIDLSIRTFRKSTSASVDHCTAP